MIDVNDANSWAMNGQFMKLIQLFLLCLQLNAFIVM